MADEPVSAGGGGVTYRHNPMCVVSVTTGKKMYFLDYNSMMAHWYFPAGLNWRKVRDYIAACN